MYDDKNVMSMKNSVLKQWIHVKKRSCFYSTFAVIILFSIFILCV